MSGERLKNLRIPPQDLEAEKALLGSIMLKPEAINDIIDIIKPVSFYPEKHRIIFDAMLALHAKSEPIDLLSITSKLKGRKRLEQAGGRSYLASLVNEVPFAGNASHYARTVQAKYMMRALIEAADFISEVGYNEAHDVDEALDKAEKKIYEVTQSPSIHRYVALKDTLAEAWDEIDRLHKSKDEIRGIRTGFRDLDTLLAGLQKSDLIILAARPSMGKTALALDIARQTAIHHKTHVCIFSLEMSSQQLLYRMLAAESRVNSWKLRTGKLSTDSEFDQLREGLDRLQQAPIYIDDMPASTILNMRSVARRIKSEHGLGLIIVDYLQMMNPTTTRVSDSLVQQVTEISRSLKTLARELDVPVLALSQLSRAIEQRRGRPRLSDLRDSGSIEQDADVVMFIHREDKMNESSDRPNIAEILVEKHRNGPIGKVELYFDEQKATFLPIDKSDFGEFEGVTKASEAF